MKKFGGIAIALVIAIAAFVNEINESKRDEKVEELIDKVDDLTKKLENAQKGE